MQKKKPPNSIVNPAINSDSASAKSKGIRPVSNKKVIISIGKIGRYIKISHLKLLCIETICRKDKDSDIINKNIIKKFNNISRFSVLTIILLEANIAYLLFDTQPTNNNNIEKNRDIIPIRNKLYSISHTIKLGPHTRLTQNKYEVINIKHGIIIIKNLVVLFIISICLNNNFKASAINCNLPL